MVVLVHQVGAPTNVSSRGDKAELERVVLGLDPVSGFVTLLVDSFESASLGTRLVVRAESLVPRGALVAISIVGGTMSPSPVSV